MLARSSNNKLNTITKCYWIHRICMHIDHRQSDLIICTGCNTSSIWLAPINSELAKRDKFRFRWISVCYSLVRNGAAFKTIRCVCLHILKMGNLFICNAISPLFLTRSSWNLKHKFFKREEEIIFAFSRKRKQIKIQGKPI